MNKSHVQHTPVAASEKTAAVGRVFKFSFKGIPPVNAAMQARLEAAARIPRKDRHYPVIVEVPDGSIY